MAPLDEHQQAAVAHGDGPAIVLAGPGSGKTRVIVERAVRLIDEELARPEQLLVLTFSRKAATDLRERIAARLQRSYASFPVTTFHAFCLALLTRDAAEPPRLARPAERRRAMRSGARRRGQPRPAPDERARRGGSRASPSSATTTSRCPSIALARVREAYVDGLDRARRASTTAASSARRSRCSSSDEDAARAYQADVPLRPRRRVPGHERRPGAAARADRRRAPQRLLRRRRGPVDLRLPRQPRSRTRSASRTAGRARHATTCRRTTARPRRSSSSRRASSAATSTRTSASRSRGRGTRARARRPHLPPRRRRGGLDRARDRRACAWTGSPLGRDRRPRPLAAGRSARGSPTRSAATRSRSTRRSHHSSTRPPVRCSRCSSSPPPIHGRTGTTTRPCACSPRRSSAPIPSSCASFRRSQRTLYGALRDSGALRPVLRGARDRQAAALGRRRDLRALGSARPLPRARRCRATRRDEQIEELAARDRALGCRERVRRRARPTFPAAFRERRARTPTSGCRARPPTDRRGRAPHRAPGEGARVGCRLRLRPRRGSLPGARPLAVRPLRPRRFRPAPARRGRAGPPGARGGAAPLLRRADPRAHAGLPHRDRGGARGSRPRAFPLLPRGAAVPRRGTGRATASSRSEEALAALRRAGGGPPAGATSSRR